MTGREKNSSVNTSLCGAVSSPVSTTNAMWRRNTAKQFKTSDLICHTSVRSCRTNLALSFHDASATEMRTGAWNGHAFWKPYFLHVAFLFLSVSANVLSYWHNTLLCSGTVQNLVKGARWSETLPFFASPPPQERGRLRSFASDPSCELSVIVPAVPFTENFTNETCKDKDIFSRNSQKASLWNCILSFPFPCGAYGALFSHRSIANKQVKMGGFSLQILFGWQGAATPFCAGPGEAWGQLRLACHTFGIHESHPLRKLRMFPQTTQNFQP